MGDKRDIDNAHKQFERMFPQKPPATRTPSARFDGVSKRSMPEKCAAANISGDAKATTTPKNLERRKGKRSINF